MGLPDNSRVEDGFLVFWELAHPDTLQRQEELYEYACFHACTNSFRPAGPLEIALCPLPDLEATAVAVWGGRALTAEAVGQYRAQGMVLARIRLPVSPMGLAGSSQERPRPPI